MNDKQQITGIVTRFRRFDLETRQEQLLDTLRRRIEDPLRPKTNQGSFRINPILVLLAILALLAGGTFLLFSLVHL
jgi:hypothetical protein